MEIKIDRVELHKLIHEKHMSQAAVARLFGVNKSSVSRALKELRPAVAAAVALEAGHKIVSRQLDIVDQLMKSNLNIDSMIEDLKLKLRGIKTTTPEVKGKEIRLVIKDLEEEKRRQWGVQMDILKTIHNFQSIAEFQAAVLETLGEANKCPGCGEEIACAKCGVKVDLRAQALLKLKQKRAMRAGATFKP